MVNEDTQGKLENILTKYDILIAKAIPKIEIIILK